MITSPDNPRVKEVVRLQTKARARRESGLFPAEGRKLFLETPEELRTEVFVSASFAKEAESFLRGRPCEIVDDRVFRKMCATQTPQGILTIARMPQYQRDDLLKGEREPLMLFLEDIQDPGNIGTILRTAEAAGATGILMTEGCADLFQPKVVRATMGSIFRMPFRVEQDSASVLAWFRETGVRIYAASLEGEGSFTEQDYTVPTVFLIGNEGSGLSPALQAAADRRIRIPMHGQVESLNAAVAASLLLYEADRLRRLF